MTWTVDPMHTQVEFSAKHMGIMTVKGHFTGLQAAINFTEDDFSASSVDCSSPPISSAPLKFPESTTAAETKRNCLK